MNSSFYHRQSDTKTTNEPLLKQAKDDVKDNTEEKNLEDNKKTVLSVGEGEPEPVPTSLQGLMAYSNSDSESDSE